MSWFENTGQGTSGNLRVTCEDDDGLFISLESEDGSFCWITEELDDAVALMNALSAAIADFQNKS